MRDDPNVEIKCQSTRSPRQRTKVVCSLKSIEFNVSQQSEYLNLGRPFASMIRLKIMMMFFCLIIFSVIQVTHTSGSDDWDYMVFTQQWPESVCLETQVTHQHTCQISQNVSTWSLHGIWPTKSGTFGPNFCNKTEKFNPKLIEPLDGLLLKYWPNLYTDSSPYSFWEHEWTKHGTCATGIASLQGEYNFFNQALKLNQRYDILSLLKKLNVVPKSDYVYQYSTMLAAMEKALGGKVKIQCFYNKATKTQYIEQVEMCLDKSFNAMDCPGKDNGGGCSDTEPIAYLPIKHPYSKSEKGHNDVY
jgi:ribonuclease T2